MSKKNSIVMKVHPNFKDDIDEVHKDLARQSGIKLSKLNIKAQLTKKAGETLKEYFEKRRRFLDAQPRKRGRII